MVGVTSWALSEIASMTLPQLQLILEGLGPILLPRLKPALDANFANLDADQARKIVKRHAAALRGVPAPNPTPEEQDRQRAYEIVNAYYLGEHEQPAAQPKAEPLPIPRETAAAIVEAAKARLIPEDIFGEIVPIWRRIVATAEESPR